MLGRKTELRRTGFKRPAYERKPVVLTPVPEHLRKRVSTGPAELKAAPKSPPGRSQAYRDLARGKPCMMQIPFVCNNDPETTVLAHSNSQANGKGMGIKADDAIGAVWACYACHTWVDQGSTSAAVKELAFRRASQRMQVELERLVGDPLCKQRDRNAAQWALDRIRGAASPV